MASLAETLRQVGYVTPQGVTGPRTQLAQQLKNYATSVIPNAQQNLAQQRADIDAALTMGQRGVQIGDREAFERQMAQASNLGGVMKVSGAMKTAQKNAALPVEQGGLGLPPNNTPMDRAKALGFDVENMWYRGDKPNLTEFNPNDPSNYIQGNIFLTDKKPIAAWYARTGKPKNIMNMPSDESEGVYSLFTKNNPRELKIDANESSWVDIPAPKAWKKSFYGGTGQIDDVALMANQKKYPSMQVNNVLDQYGLGNQKVIFNPSDIRSINAAFDPKRKKEANILAGALAMPLATDEDNRRALLEKLFNEQQK